MDKNDGKCNEERRKESGDEVEEKTDQSVKGEKGKEEEVKENIKRKKDNKYDDMRSLTKEWIAGRRKRAMKEKEEGNREGEERTFE